MVQKLTAWTALTVAEAITRCALERTESRGAHFREDFPDKDEAWGGVNLVVKKGDDGEMTLRRQQLPDRKPEHRAIIEEMQ